MHSFPELAFHARQFRLIRLVQIKMTAELHCRLVIMHQIETKGPPVGPHIEDRAHATASAIEVTGVIKWFNVAKGYGFVVPDNGMSDVLLSVTCLRRDGFQVVHEGARVVVEVLRGPRGLHAFRILSMDPSAAVHAASSPGPHSDVAESGDAAVTTIRFHRAQVKWFNRVRGFGFLTRGKGTPDIFVHAITLRRFRLTELLPGQFVLVRFVPGPKGMLAIEVRPALPGSAMH